MAWRTRYISSVPRLKLTVSLHGLKSAAYFTFPALVWVGVLYYILLLDFGYFWWTSLESDGFHPTPSDKWIPMKSIGQHLYPTWFSSNFRYPFVLWISVILEGVTSRSFLIPWENLVYSMESICMFWTCVTNTQPTMYLFSWHTLLKGIWEVFWCVVSDQKGKGNVLTAIVSLLSFCLTRVKLWSLAQHWNDTAFGVCSISLY